MQDLFQKEQEILNHAVFQLESLQQGASLQAEDFETIVTAYGRLLKQFRWMMKMSDRTTIDLNASKQDLLDKVNYDALTGIYNRRFLDETLAAIFQNPTTLDTMLSILVLDIDFFKRYNDTYGHGAGDECLKTVARTLHTSLRATGGFVARYGGEEFVIVLPKAARDAACALALEIKHLLQELAVVHEKNDASDYVTVSIGITSGLVSQLHSAEMCMAVADKALYQAKHEGRNRHIYIDYVEVSR